jgi:4-amino-4-deoxy-L-arabinose transferase-like glycosyltransferase
LVSAVVLAVSPVTLLLNRGNISDSLLILLLVLAADATTKAIVDGGVRPLLMAGLWVGLAFQAKMVQAWLVLPALFLAYLVAARPPGFLQRCRHVAVATVVVGVVSLSWMTVVSVVPAHDRPYADGSCDNSVFSQVFLYNGIDRITSHELDARGCSPPSLYLVNASREGAAVGVSTFAIPRSWDRLLWGPLGRDDAWLMLPALVSAVAVLAARRRQIRIDLVRAAALLWTAWLVITGAFFSSGQYLNSYYVAALTPAVGALCGMGAALAWRHRSARSTKLVIAAIVAGNTAYALVLVPGDAGIHATVVVSSIAVAVLGVGLVLSTLWRSHAGRWRAPTGLGLCATAVLIGSVWASGSVLASGQGPFDTPYEPNLVTYLNQTRPAQLRAEWPDIVAFANTFPEDRATDVFETSGAAGYDIMVTGHEALPVGGFTGRVPAPTVAQFAAYVAHGRVTRALVAVGPPSSNPVMRWITRHCPKQRVGDATFQQSGTTFQRYQCAPADGGETSSAHLAR